jgi:hypothetical protein
VCRAGHCEHELKANTCLLEGVCYAEGQTHPSAQCQYCHQGEWTGRTAGVSCDDGVYCNGADSCGSGAQAGRCGVHAGNPCGSTNACQTCSESARSCSSAGDSTWYDASSKLLWQRSVSTTQADWQTASDKCAGLTSCGYSDWRLPTVDELRTLIRGCTATESGGVCRVTSQCGTDSCWNTDCNSCPTLMSGSYLPSSLAVNSDLTWSATLRGGDAASVWTVFFPQGAIQSKEKKNWGEGRCVRAGR